MIKIRYNTEKDKTDPKLYPWRVIEGGIERLAKSVRIESKAWTTQDEISPGLMKWHITCEGKAVWSEDGTECVIR